MGECDWNIIDIYIYITDNNQLDVDLATCVCVFLGVTPLLTNSKMP